MVTWVAFLSHPVRPTFNRAPPNVRLGIVAGGTEIEIASAGQTDAAAPQPTAKAGTYRAILNRSWSADGQVLLAVPIQTPDARLVPIAYGEGRRIHSCAFEEGYHRWFRAHAPKMRSPLLDPPRKLSARSSPQGNGGDGRSRT